MANGSWLDPNINAWWLKQDDPTAATTAAFGQGMALARQRMENQQQAKREETMMKFKMLDFMLEGERNNIAFQTFKNKQDQELQKSKSMAEIGEYLSTAIKNNRLLDPETQAGFYNLTSKHAPFIDHNTVNSIWDNTFGNAIRRDDEAKKIRAGGPNAAAFIQYDERVAQKEAELKAMSDPASPTYNPDLIAEKQREIERFRVGSGLVTAEESRAMRVAEYRAGAAEERAKERMEFEREMAGVRAGTAKEMQNIREQDKISLLKLKTDVAAIQDKYGIPIISATGNKERQDKLIADQNRELDEVFNRHIASFDTRGKTNAPAAAPAATTPATEPVLEFDPNTYQIRR